MYVCVHVCTHCVPEKSPRLPSSKGCTKGWPSRGLAILHEQSKLHLPDQRMASSSIPGSKEGAMFDNSIIYIDWIDWFDMF